jgi:uncharacterized membrane protein YecN with MAPEG domain
MSVAAVTGSFVVPFTAYFSFLSYRVVRCRLSDNYFLGDNSSKGGSASSHQSNDLYRASRCFSNFTEYVPMALALAAVAELNGANRKLLSAGLSTLLVFRVMHAEAGLLQGADGVGKGRPIGYLGTVGTMLGFAGYTAFLVKDYWGF